MTHKSVVWTFARLQPPTIGHEKLINKIHEIAKINNSDTMLFLSQTCDNDTNPLSWEDKCKIAKKAFNINVIQDESIKTPFQALEELCKQYTHITMVVGDDRAETFLKRMTPYAIEWGVESFTVINAGDRNTDSIKVDETASATLARKCVLENDFNGFNKITASALNIADKRKLFKTLKNKLTVD